MRLVTLALCRWVVLLSLGAACALCARADWLRWRGPNGDGVSTETAWTPAALSAGPKIVWQANVGAGFSSVAIQGSYLYTLGSDSAYTFVLCLDANNGKQLWRVSYECRQGTYGPQATPTASGGLIFKLRTEGHLHCLDARTGKILWARHLVKDFKVVRPYYGFAGSPVYHSISHRQSPQEIGSGTTIRASAGVTHRSKAGVAFPGPLRSIARAGFFCYPVIMGKVRMARLVRRGPEERTFDREFWQKVGPEGRFAAAWEMTAHAVLIRGNDARKSGLQRSVQNILRRKG
jgi:hypothetical protein